MNYSLALYNVETLDFYAFEVTSRDPFFISEDKKDIILGYKGLTSLEFHNALSKYLYHDVLYFKDGYTFEQCTKEHPDHTINVTQSPYVGIDLEALARRSFFISNKSFNFKVGPSYTDYKLDVMDYLEDNVLAYQANSLGVLSLAFNSPEEVFKYAKLVFHTHLRLEQMYLNKEAMLEDGFVEFSKSLFEGAFKGFDFEFKDLGIVDSGLDSYRFDLRGYLTRKILDIPIYVNKVSRVFDLKFKPLETPVDYISIEDRLLVMNDRCHKYKQFKLNFIKTCNIEILDWNSPDGFCVRVHLYLTLPFSS